ncbi:hypothetical protein [Nocardioides sp. CER19]|uniref:hypothetical protein n=1 Tax=Nocardioides sp. CER19 TaxID=3038538 RepID=UPI002448956C|nr:hypothetical protein [Nocardioides sp. CER19]MDH2413944.1 hypothetical protein [Nocardioides sp. CER19]
MTSNQEGVRSPASVWLIMAGGRRGRLAAGPYDSEEIALRAYETLLNDLSEDGDGWGGPLEPDQFRRIWTIEAYEVLDTPDLGTLGAEGEADR